VPLKKVDAHRVLTLEQAQEKRIEQLPLLLDEIKQVKVIESGYSLRFGLEPTSLILVCDWLQIERICQPFLRMRLSIESNQGPIWLDLSGPAGTQNFLKSEYGLNRWL
jgi:hypothetical protein